MNFDHWRDVDGFSAALPGPKTRRRVAGAGRAIPIDRTYTKLALAQRKQPRAKTAPLITKAPNYEATIGAAGEANDFPRGETRNGWTRTVAEFSSPAPMQDAFEFGGETA